MVFTFQNHRYWKQPWNFLLLGKNIRVLHCQCLVDDYTCPCTGLATKLDHWFSPFSFNTTKSSLIETSLKKFFNSHLKQGASGLGLVGVTCRSILTKTTDPSQVNDFYPVLHDWCSIHFMEIWKGLLKPEFGFKKILSGRWSGSKWSRIGSSGSIRRPVLGETTQARSPGFSPVCFHLLCTAGILSLY